MEKYRLGWFEGEWVSLAGKTRCLILPTETALWFSGLRSQPGEPSEIRMYCLVTWVDVWLNLILTFRTVLNVEHGFGRRIRARCITRGGCQRGWQSSDRGSHSLSGNKEPHPETKTPGFDLWKRVVSQPPPSNNGNEWVCAK